MTRTRSIRAAFLALSLAACSSESLSHAPDGSSGAGGVTGAGGAAGSPSVQQPNVRKAYPEGPYGRGKGAVIANLSFLGWRNPQASNFDPNKLEKVELADFYNPGGTTNDVKLILLNASAVWCSVCRSEYRHISSANIYASYRPRGLEMLGVLFEDANYNPAKPSDLVVWGGPDGYDLPFGLVLDPAFKTGSYFESDATPMNMLIDARTMQILDVTMGYNASSPNDYWNAIGDLLQQ